VVKEEAPASVQITEVCVRLGAALIQCEDSRASALQSDLPRALLKLFAAAPGGNKAHMRLDEQLQERISCIVKYCIEGGAAVADLEVPAVVHMLASPNPNILKRALQQCSIFLAQPGGGAQLINGNALPFLVQSMTHEDLGIAVPAIFSSQSICHLLTRCCRTWAVT
jgi:hypothetical protein